MHEILLIIFVIVSIALIGLILIQQGKGADMGASFGAGASGTVFGSSGSGNFLTKSTAILATLFFVLSLALGYMANQQVNSKVDFIDVGFENKGSTVPAAVSDQPATPAENVVPVESAPAAPSTKSEIPAE